MPDLEMKPAASRGRAGLIAGIIIAVVILIGIIVAVWIYLRTPASTISNTATNTANTTADVTNTVSNNTTTNTADNTSVSNTASNTTASDNATTSNSISSTTTPDLLDGYQVSNNDTYGYSFQFPKTWFWHRISQSFFTLGAKEADLAVANSGNTGKMGLVVAVYSAASNPAGTTSEEVSINGVSAKKYMIPAADTEMGPEPKMVTYVFPLSGGKSLIVTDKDDYQLSVFNKVVNSIVIK